MARASRSKMRKGAVAFTVHSLEVSPRATSILLVPKKVIISKWIVFTGAQIRRMDTFDFRFLQERQSQEKSRSTGRLHGRRRSPRKEG